MHFYQKERVALFIDGANLYATSKALDFDIDFKRLLDFFRGKSTSRPRSLLHGADGGSGILIHSSAQSIGSTTTAIRW